MATVLPSIGEALSGMEVRFGATTHDTLGIDKVPPPPRPFPAPMHPPPPALLQISSAVALNEPYDGPFTLQRPAGGSVRHGAHAPLGAESAAGVHSERFMDRYSVVRVLHAAS
jgi:hypothetical protein